MVMPASVIIVGGAVEPELSKPFNETMSYIMTLMHLSSIRLPSSRSLKPMSVETPLKSASTLSIKHLRRSDRARRNTLRRGCIEKKSSLSISSRVQESWSSL